LSLIIILGIHLIINLKSNSMESKKPDNVVYSDDEGFNASVLPYGTNVGAGD
jgi:hypothetical protein